MLHRLLGRQLKKLGVDESTPPDAASWPQLLEQISRTYTEVDQDRYLLERSLSISSQEMQELYEKLRQSSETRIAAERDRLQAVIRSLGDGLCALDQDGNLLFINPEGERLLGYQEAELVGQPVLDLVEVENGAVPSGARGGVSLRTMVGSGQPYRNEDGRLRRKDGATFPVSYVVNPITKDGELLGAVLVFRDITERKRAEEALERHAAQLALINDVGRQIAAVLELNSVLDRAAHLVQERFGYHHVALFTLDQQRGELVMRTRAGDFGHLFPPDHRLKVGQGVVGWVCRHGETVLANDVDQEPRYVNLYPDQIPTRAEMSVPIRVGEEVVGVLDVQSPQRYAFSEEDVLVMQTLADQIALAIKNARLFEEAERLASTVRELSAPVIQVWDQVLVLPLIGGIDEARARRIMETLLQGVTQHHAQVVIIDVTGVSLIDSLVADYLLQTTRAAELLGARCVLTGISPEVAQTIVRLGLPLTKLTSLPNLQAGIRYALNLLGRGPEGFPPKPTKPAASRESKRA